MAKANLMFGVRCLRAPAKNISCKILRFGLPQFYSRVTTLHPELEDRSNDDIEGDAHEEEEPTNAPSEQWTKYCTTVPNDIQSFHITS